MDLLIIFLFGLVIGSFLLVLIDRLPQNKSVLVGRSECDSCHHILSWYDLVPVFSYVSLLGKCRYCKRTLSLKYPAMEVMTGLLFVLLYATVMSGYVAYPSPFASPILLFLFLTIIAATLLVIFFTDLYYGIIPLGVVLVGVFATLLYLGIGDSLLLLRHLGVGLMTMLFFLVIYLGTKRRGIGFGDVVYGFYMGLLLGFPHTLIGLYLAFLTGAFVSIILVVLKKKRLRGDSVPFGPFLICGTILSLVSGDTIWEVFRVYIGL